MTQASSRGAAPRSPRSRAKPTRESIAAAAIALADREGLEALTIRALATRMGVGPMTLYHYVEGKDQVLDAMVDTVFAQIDLPDLALPWQEAIRARCRSARAVLTRHPWSVPLLESRRQPGPATLRHHDAMLACFFSAGMPMALTAHAYAVIDSYVYGFVIQEAHLPVQSADDAEITGDIAAHLDPAQFPHLLRFAREHAMRPGYAFGDSFDYGLDLLLDGFATAAASRD